MKATGKAIKQEWEGTYTINQGQNERCQGAPCTETVKWMGRKRWKKLGMELEGAGIGMGRNLGRNCEVNRQKFIEDARIGIRIGMKVGMEWGHLQFLPISFTVSSLFLPSFFLFHS